MIKAVNIHKRFGNLEVIRGISLDVNKGEILSMVGPLGAGKTTLLQILGTLDSPTHIDGVDSYVEIDGHRTSGMKDKELSRFRSSHIGFIFQSHRLLPEFTAIENICMPALIAGRSMKEAEKRALMLLDFMSLSHRLNHYPSQLSGGEEQRISVARALMNNPSVIFADEPSGNLDSTSADALHRLFLSLREEFGQTFVIVTHNDSLASMADRCVKMRDGVIENISLSL